MGDAYAAFYALATIQKGSHVAPRVRYVVHRGFLGDSDCLLTTTDVRSEKGKQMGMEQRVPVELAWYIAAERIQFRIRGQAFLIVQVDENTRDVTSPTTEGYWPATQDWKAERMRMWQSLSPEMQQSFVGPSPGTPLSSAFPDSDSQAATKRQNSDISPNFALLVIEPSEVDQLDLSTFRRTIYTREKSGDWSHVEVVP